MKLLTRNTHKMEVTEGASGTRSVILHLAPVLHNACPFSTSECRELCLNTAGRGQMNSVQLARRRKSDWLHDEPDAFVARLIKEIHSHARCARRDGQALTVRLNGTSDIPWEISHPKIFTEEYVGDVSFYDYTKWPVARRAPIPGTYTLTYSYSGTLGSRRQARRALDAGWPVAVCFSKRTFAQVIEAGQWSMFPSAPVVNGDLSDIRTADGGSIVALEAKGLARRAEDTNFVVTEA